MNVFNWIIAKEEILDILDEHIWADWENGMCGPRPFVEGYEEAATELQDYFQELIDKKLEQQYDFLTNWPGIY